LGRTARAGKSGSGTILLYDFEESFMLRKVLKDLEITRQAFSPEDISSAYLEAQNVLRSNFDHDLRTCGEQAYQAWLGFYNSNLRSCGWDKNNLVVMANRYAQTIGFQSPPALEAKTIGKMGLKGIPGLNIQRKSPS
jgi:ATP-dependent RNA helicase MSS116